MKPKDPRLYWYLEKLEELRDNPKVKVIGLSKEEFLEYVDFLFGPILDNKGKTLFIEDFRYIPFTIDKILKIDLQEYLKAKGNVPQEIIQAAEDFGDDMEIERTRLVARNKVETFIKKQEQLKSANIAQAQEDVSQKAQALVKASLPGSLARDAEVVKKLSRVIENELTAAYLATILPDDLSPQVLQKVTQHIIETAELPEQLMAIEPSLPPNVAQLIKANLRNLKWSPETMATIKEMNQTGFVLPRELREGVPEAGRSPSVLDVVRKPHLFLKKVALFPLAKTAEAISKASLDNEKFLLQEIKKLKTDPRRNRQKIMALEWQLYESSRFRTKNKVYAFFTGLTKDDLEQFRTHLTITRGLGTTDFRVRYIDNQIESMKRFVERSRMARLYYHYLHFDRATDSTQPKLKVGQREFYLPRIKPLSDFSQKITGFGEQIGFYRQFVEYPGIKVIRSIPFQKFADFRSFISRKTLQPIFARLGQTAIGQGLKSGIRSIISSGFIKTIITKLGIKALTTAIGSVLTTPIGGILAGLIVEPLLEIGKNLLSKFKQLITKPEFALGMGAISGIFFIGVPGTAGVVGGAFFATLSGLGLAASAGGILGSASAATVAIMTAFFAPLGAPIAALVIGIILGLFFLTLFIVFLTASAFIIPASPEELRAPPKGSVYFSVEKTASQEEFTNEDLEENPSIAYAFKVTAQQPIILTTVRDQRILTCHPNSPAQLDTTPFNLPHSDEPITEWDWKSDDNHQLDLDPSFADCRICNTVIVIANVINEESGETIASGEMDTATVCIDIGNPPEDCPSGWPTRSGYVTQGPRAGYSHDDPYLQEAIDIGVIKGTPVYATHEGDVVESDWGSATIKIRGVCEGEFFSIYHHLSSRAVSPGEHVHKEDLIGHSGAGGDGQQHLHYEFEGLEMAYHYIGTDPGLDDILEGCCLSHKYCQKLCTDPDIRPYATW